MEIDTTQLLYQLQRLVNQGNLALHKNSKAVADEKSLIHIRYLLQENAQLQRELDACRNIIEDYVENSSGQGKTTV